MIFYEPTNDHISLITIYCVIFFLTYNIYSYIDTSSTKKIFKTNIETVKIKIFILLLEKCKSILENGELVILWL